MLVRHEFEIRSNCPMDGKQDRYDAIVETNRVIFAEYILEAIEEFATQKIPQELLTTTLARKLGATVTTCGVHSGVKTTVIAS